MFLYYLFLLISTALFCTASNVPVLIWSNLRHVEESLPSTLQSVPYARFEQYFFNSFPTKNVLLFLQDQLSNEDFSGNENVFKNVQKQVQRYNSVYLPNVENPSFLINDLPDYGYKVKKLTENELNSDFIKKSQSSNAIIIKLPSTTQSSNRKYPLQITDEIIRKALKNIEKLEDFTVVITALQSVTHIEEALKGEVKHSIKKRNAKLANKTFKTKCAMLHVNKNFLYVKDSKSYVLAVDKLTDSTVSKCESNSTTIQINYGGIDQLGDVSITFNFALKNRKKWSIHSAVVKSSLNKSPKLLQAPNWVPLMMVNESLACVSPITFVGKTLQLGRATEWLRISGIQVEAFTKDAKKFSRAIDCVGFFSLSIWAGLLVMFLLVGILSWGFYMIACLKTMDHFDDPKAKPLVQSTSE